MTEERDVERTLTVLPTEGTNALAAMDEAAFERQLAAIRQGQIRLGRMQKELLIAGTDYGNIPGIDKPSLGKPGAEKICLAYRLAARVEQRLTVGDGVTSPTLTYDATCHLHLGSFDGPEVGVGHGSCNSWETKYRWRNQERSCPTCGNATIIAGKAEYGGGWLCFKKRGGCGAKFGAEDPRITGQQTGREENPEPWDLANTIMKMAEKRSHVDATLRTTAASGIFTQDLEENVPVVEGEYTEVREQRPAPVVSRPRATTEPPPLSDADLAVVNPEYADRLAAARDEAEVDGLFEYAEPLELSSEQIRDRMREAHILSAVATTTARDLFPDWNGRDDLTNRQRGQIWEALNP